MEMLKRSVTDLPLPPAKRTCIAATQCLHCKSPFHTWSRCTGGCVHCSEPHPGRRCSVLPLALYIPGGFTILNGTAQSSSCMSSISSAGNKSENGLALMPILSASNISAAGNCDIQPAASSFTDSGINLGRASMIATTPEIRIVPNHEPIGKQKTASNSLPLGRPNRLAGQQQHFEPPQHPQQNNADHAHQRPAMGQVFEAEDEKTWQALCEHIYRTVRGARDSTKTQNNGRDDNRVDTQIRNALNLIRPSILRHRKRK